MNHKLLSLNIGKRVKYFWPCQSSYRLYCPSVLVSNKVKERNFLSLDHKPYQRHCCCAMCEKVQDNSFPIELDSCISLFCGCAHHPAETQQEQVSSGGNVPFSTMKVKSVHESLFVTISTDRSVEAAKTASLLQVYSVFQAVTTIRRVAFLFN